jgi:serine phosphatase RsbU (regulator of sigma subunit)
VLDRATGELSYANAGHPPPVCISVTGSVDYLDAATGTMLGAPGDGVFTTGNRRLPPGAGLLLYTDGLIESHDRDISDGLTALASAMHQTRGLTADQTCTTVQTVLLAGAPRADDVCLLAGRLTI